MILTVDMGNSHIELGILEGDEVILSERIATDIEKTASEYAVLIHSIFEIRNISSASSFFANSLKIFSAFSKVI